MTNVQEDLFRARIDPLLTRDVLTAFASDALGEQVWCDGYTVLTGGLWNRVILVSADDGRLSLVVKITPQPRDAALRREYDVLRYFRAHTALPVPEPYLLDSSGDRLPGSVLIMAQIPGRVLSAVRETLTADERRTIAEELADYLVELHTYIEPGFGGVEVAAEERSATWFEFWTPRYDLAVAEAREKGLLNAALLDGLAELRGYFPALLDIGPRGTLTHYDIWTGNVMVDNAGGRVRVSGFLDILGYFADYARELSSMFSLADEPLMKVYRERHGLDAGFQARFAAYSLKMCLQLVVMYPAEPQHVEDARRFLAQALAYCKGVRNGA
jgi:fructosamine-3-kinase